MSKARNISNLFSASTDLSTDAEVTAALSTHSSAADPHSVYLKESEYAGKNFCINGGMDIWQRGISFTTDSSATWIYTADRWAAQNLYSGGGAVNVVTQETTHVPIGSKYSIKSVVGTAPGPNTGRMNLLYTFEHQDAIDLAGKVITISAQVKSIGAIDRYNIAAYYSTSGGKAHAGTTYIGGGATPVNTSGFTKISTTITVPSSATLTSTGTLSIMFTYYKNNAAAESVGDGAYISQVKIEEGSQATTFSTAEPTLAGELVACQRYYEQSFAIGTAPSTSAVGVNTSHTYHYPVNPTRSFSIFTPFKVTKRAAPSIVTYSTTNTGAVTGHSFGVGYTNITWGTNDISANYFSGESSAISYNEILMGWTASAEL